MPLILALRRQVDLSSRTAKATQKNPVIGVGELNVCPGDDASG